MVVSRQKRVIFTAYGGGHAVMLAAVIKALSHDTRIACSALGLTTGYDTLAATGVPTYRFKDLVDRRVDADALALGEELASDLDRNALIDREESVAYLGLSMSELVEAIGVDAAWAAYRLDGRRAFRPLETVGRLLDRVRPDLVVSTNSPRAERAMIEAATERGLPSICLCDAFVRSDFETSYLARSDYAMKLGVMSATEAEFLASRGRARETMEVCGNPAFDSVVEPGIVEAGRRRRASLGWETNRVLLVALQGATSTFSPDSDRLNRMLLSAAGEALLRFANMRVILRPHPTFTPDYSESALSSWGDRATLSEASHHRHVEVHASDVLATPRSTLATEAAMAGLPCITIHSDDYPMPLAELGISTEVRTESELVTAIAEAKPPNLDRLGAPPVGTHAARCAGLVRSMLSLD